MLIDWSSTARLILRKKSGSGHFIFGFQDSDPETKIEFVAQHLPKSEYGKPAMNEAWQREMSRVWEARPPGDEGLDQEGRSWLQVFNARGIARRKAEEEEKAKKQAEMEAGGAHAKAEG